MNNKKTLLALLLGTTLSACSMFQGVETKNVQIEPIPSSEVCCSRFSEFPWTQLESNEDVEFAIDESSPVGHFAGGNSHFQAFQLSERTASATIRLSSNMKKGRVLAPRIVTLDAQFNVVDTIELTQFRVRTSDAFTLTQFVTTFDIDGSKTPFFVVHTSEEYLGDEIKVPHPARVRAQEAGEPMPIVVDPVYVQDHFGQLEMEITTNSLRSYKIKEPSAVAPITTIESKQVKNALPETQTYYHNAIKTAVEEGNIPKALSLLDEAKALNIKDAQAVFVKAVNSSNTL